VAFLVAGCAEIGFPAVHDMPAPRADTTMTPDQVKQATDDLVSERDRLNGSLPSAQAAAPSNAPPAKKRALPAKKPAAKAPAAAQNAAPAAAPDAAVTAGAYAKP
jgi:hypothetical protein